ncbi:hypothetical protein ACTXT7_015733 [Hymenolepis weldensis]
MDLNIKKSFNSEYKPAPRSKDVPDSFKPAVEGKPHNSITLNGTTFSTSDKRLNLQISEIPLNSGTCSGILSSDSRKSLLSSLLTVEEERDMKLTPDDHFHQKPAKALLGSTSMEEKKNLLPGSNEESRPQSAPSDKRKSEILWDGLENIFFVCSSNKGDTFDLNEPIAEKKFISDPKKTSTDCSILLSEKNNIVGTSRLIFNGNGSSAEVQRLQAEVDSLRSLLKMVRDYHKEEIKLLEQSNAKGKASSAAAKTLKDTYGSDAVNEKICRRRETNREQDAQKTQFCAIASCH